MTEVWRRRLAPLILLLWLAAFLRFFHLLFPVFFVLFGLSEGYLDFFKCPCRIGYLFIEFLDLFRKLFLGKFLLLDSEVDFLEFQQIL